MLAPTTICLSADKTSAGGTDKSVFSVAHKHRCQYIYCGIPTGNCRRNHNEKGEHCSPLRFYLTASKTITGGTGKPVPYKGALQNSAVR